MHMKDDFLKNCTNVTIAVTFTFNVPVSYCSHSCCSWALLWLTLADRNSNRIHCIEAPCDWQLISGRHNCCLSGLETSLSRGESKWTAELQPCISSWTPTNGRLSPSERPCRRILLNVRKPQQWCCTFQHACVRAYFWIMNLPVCLVFMLYFYRATNWCKRDIYYCNSVVLMTVTLKDCFMSKRPSISLNSNSNQICLFQ